MSCLRSISVTVFQCLITTWGLTGKTVYIGRWINIQIFCFLLLVLVTNMGWALLYSWDIVHTTSTDVWQCQQETSQNPAVSPPVQHPHICVRTHTYRNAHCLCTIPQGCGECVEHKPMPLCMFNNAHLHTHTLAHKQPKAAGERAPGSLWPT